MDAQRRQAREPVLEQACVDQATANGLSAPHRPARQVGVFDVAGDEFLDHVGQCPPDLAGTPAGYLAGDRQDVLPGGKDDYVGRIAGPFVAG